MQQPTTARFRTETPFNWSSATRTGIRLINEVRTGSRRYQWDCAYYKFQRTLRRNKNARESPLIWRSQDHMTSGRSSSLFQTMLILTRILRASAWPCRRMDRRWEMICISCDELAKVSQGFDEIRRKKRWWAAGKDPGWDGFKMFLFGGLDYGDFLEVLPATSSETGFRDNDQNKKCGVDLFCFGEFQMCFLFSRI